MGAHILSPAQAPAGTKRLSNLLRSPKWSHTLLEKFLWRRAGQELTRLEGAGQAALAIWDESVLEKPESIALEGLCPVRSSKAARLKRIKPGYYNPPGGPPVFVPGLQWLTVMLAGMQGPPCLAAMRWWTSRGHLASSGGNRPHPSSPSAPKAGGEGWYTSSTGDMPGLPGSGNWWHTKPDSSCAGPPATAWPTGKAASRLAHHPGQTLLTGDLGLAGANRKTGIVAVRVRHPQVDEELWLVVSRPGRGRTPWYLLTNEPVVTPDEAWRVVMAYARRWQVEMCYRTCKTDLAMESPRLWFWENRLKLLLMVSLVYAFLLAGAGAGVPGAGPAPWLVPQNRRAVPPSRDTALQTKDRPKRPMATYPPKLTSATQNSG